MSLIDDALKRQEQLSRKQAERSAPPPAPPPPAAPSTSAPTAEPPSRVSAPTPVHKPAPRPAPKPAPKPVAPLPGGKADFPRQTAGTQQSMSFLFMPLLGIIVLLILLFLRRELIPRDDVGQWEGVPDDDIVKEEPAVVELETAKPMVVSDGADSQVVVELDKPAAEPDVADSKADVEPERKSEEPEEARGQVDAETEKPAAIPAAKPEPPPATAAAPHWPGFTLSGIAVGRERLAILDSGEMLTAGETAKCGVKIERVESASVTFSWKGETKTLRKGEQSDKPADAP